MVFLGIYRALYDYVPQGANELAISEGDLLFVLEKSTDDDWWKAKKKAQSEDEDEPEGLIPNNYVEEATPIHKAKALYDYTRQTDEELSFREDATLDVYDTSDPDWALVGLDGDYGFAPSNYIEIPEEAASAMPSRPRATSQSEQEPEPEQLPTPRSVESPAQQSPAAALAGIIQQKTGSSGVQRATISPPPAITLPPRRPQYTPEESDEDTPPPPNLPKRPQSQQISPPLTQYASPRSPESPPPRVRSPPAHHHVSFRDDDDLHDSPHMPISPAGFHLYNIHEMVSHMGKNKKMPMTLGINVPKGIIMISPEKSRDGPQKEWTAEKLTLYSQEGKHVFMELVKPSKSIDFHCGAKDTAQEIVAALGELAGAARAEGLREVLAAGSGSSNVQKKGQMLFDFMAQGDDEVTVGVGDEVLILDDSASDEWWKVRRLKNGKEGVVPSNYVEIIETVSHAPSSRTGVNAGRSVVDQNRLEEDRLAREAAKADKRNGSESKGAERSKRESRDTKAPPTSKPNPARVRTWTDRSGSFKVEAEFIGLKDGKIHLHKMNGVKIAVPVPKMAIEDLEYVERMTGISLDEDKPLSDIKRKNTQRAKEREAAASAKAGITVDSPKQPDYDWFDFFLKCGVNPQICQRYASAFSRDQMGEENLPDISEKLLRTLGLKEGDILRVMKFLDNKFGRTQAREKRNVSFGGASVIEDGEGSESASGGGGLFSGPGGALRNNTRKGRPAPPVQTSDVVDAKAFEQKTDEAVKKPPPAEATATPLASAPVPEKKADGFDDNAWEVKPSKQPAPAAVSSPPPETQTSAPAPAPVTSAPAITGSLAELSLLSPPLQPTPAPQPAPQQAPAPALASQAAPQQQPQPTGATPSLFEQLAASRPPPQLPQPPSFITQQPTGFNPSQPQNQQISAPRLRPQAPQQPNQAGLIAPPPPRASSAPQNFNQQSAFGPPPLQPQLTGYQGAPNMHAQIAPPGQSLQDLNQQRMNPNFGQQPMQPMQTGFGQNPGFSQFQQNGIVGQPTGINQFAPPQQPMQTGFAPFQQPQQTGFQPQLPQQPFLNQNASPFADPPRQAFQPLTNQPTGMPQPFSPPGPLNPQATGINSFLPPALQPQRTGFQASPANFGQSGPPPVPPIPQQPTIAPLQPQKTGPAPPVRFGVSPAAQKLMPQPTGRRANLSQATPQNPFGF